MSSKLCTLTVKKLKQINTEYAIKDWLYSLKRVEFWHINSWFKRSGVIRLRSKLFLPKLLVCFNISEMGRKKVWISGVHLFLEVLVSVFKVTKRGLTCWWVHCRPYSKRTPNSKGMWTLRIPRQDTCAERRLGRFCRVSNLCKQSPRLRLRVGSPLRPGPGGHEHK